MPPSLAGASGEVFGRTLAVEGPRGSLRRGLAQWASAGPALVTQARSLAGAPSRECEQVVGLTSSRPVTRGAGEAAAHAAITPPRSPLGSLRKGKPRRE